MTKLADETLSHNRCFFPFICSLWAQPLWPACSCLLTLVEFALISRDGASRQIRGVPTKPFWVRVRVGLWFG